MAAERANLVDSIFRVQELADYIVPFAIRVVCDLGVADLLVDGPRPVEELAAATGAHAPSLHRTLRALGCKGIFAEVEPGRFALTPLAELFRSDHPLSLRGAYPLLAANFEAWARFDYTVRTGKPAFDHVHGRRYYDYLADAPYDSERFDDIQTAGTRLELRAMLRVYDWGRFDTVVDIGGGNGAFLAGLLTRRPGLRGILLELPDVAERAGAVIERAGVADRCEVVAGSFFDTMPEGADAYLLKRVLYDWDDEEAAALLRRIRAAARDDSTLLVLDPVIEPGNDFDPGKIYDLLSMTMLGGRARSRDELAELFAASGFELTQVIATDMFPVVEGRPSPQRAAERTPAGAGARSNGT